MTELTDDEIVARASQIIEARQRVAGEVERQARLEARQQARDAMKPHRVKHAPEAIDVVDVIGDDVKQTGQKREGRRDVILECPDCHWQLVSVALSADLVIRVCARIMDLEPEIDVDKLKLTPHDVVGCGVPQ